MPQLITAIVRPHALDDVRESLKAAGVVGMTITEVKGFGRQGGHTETYRGAEYTVDFLPKIKVEVIVTSADVVSVTAAIAQAARSGKVGDGKIWVAPLDQLVRIRTDERDDDAV